MTHSMIIYKLNDDANVATFTAELSEALKNNRFGCLKAKHSTVVASGDYVLSIVDHTETCNELLLSFQKLAGDFTESIELDYEIGGGMLKP